MKEIWKDIKGFEKVYQVSNKGRIKRLGITILNSGSYGGTVTLKECILKPRFDKSVRGLKHGYLRVSLKGKNFCVHRLVAEAFIPNPLNKPFVDHIDTNIDNNCVSNLRWVTQQENCQNAVSKAKRCLLLNGQVAVDIARSNGIERPAFHSRLHRGWSVYDACTKPLKHRKEK